MKYSIVCFNNIYIILFINLCFLLSNTNCKLGEKIRVKSTNYNTYTQASNIDNNKNLIEDNYLHYIEQPNDYNNIYNNLDFNGYGENIRLVSNYVNPSLNRLGGSNINLHEGTRIVHQIISRPFVKKNKSEDNNYYNNIDNNNNNNNKVKTFLDIN